MPDLASIRQAQSSDREPLVQMRVALWPESSAEEQAAEVDTWLSRSGPGKVPLTILLAEDSSGALTGFIEVGLRSHADGCDIAQPVGYIEGWFICEERRGRGAGRALMQAAEDWSRAQGAVEIASDALIDNLGSQDAHRALGFEEVDRCVHLRKRL
jgi:aminoglycoside 6'-N-acetyltransferase I